MLFFGGNMQWLSVGACAWLVALCGGVWGWQATGDTNGAPAHKRCTPSSGRPDGDDGMMVCPSNFFRHAHHSHTHTCTPPSRFLAYVCMNRLAARAFNSKTGTQESGQTESNETETSAFFCDVTTSLGSHFGSKSFDRACC